jgi:soluble lytic murein transglycosylase
MRNIYAKHFPMGVHPYLQPLERYFLQAVLNCAYLCMSIFALAFMTNLLLQTDLPVKKLNHVGFDHIYGPIPKIQLEQKGYHFDTLFLTSGSFGQLPIDRLSEFSKKEVELMVLKTVPIKLQERFSLVVPMALAFSEKYQVDPFWVMAVMWTESHFDQFAQSKMNAKGLMQILPGTGHYITKKLGKKVTKNTIYQFINKPIINIEFGTYYLKRLLKSFRGNYKLATVAYNMGPTGVRNRLRNDLPVGERNDYLDKVRRAYKKISKPFLKRIKGVSRPYEKTLVVATRFSYYTFTGRMINDLWNQYMTPRVAYSTRKSQTSQNSPKTL